jgi:hypothetical protein
MTIPMKRLNRHEGRQQREAQEVQDRPLRELPAHLEVVGQVLQREHHEQREHRVADRPVALGFSSAKITQPTIP